MLAFFEGAPRKYPAIYLSNTSPEGCGVVRRALGWLVNRTAT